MKKWILGVVGLFVAVTLAGCSSSTVANMKGAKVTKDEYYDAMKKTTTGQATLRNMIVLKALEQQYPNKVSDKKVNSQFNTLKKQYGSSFDTTLEQNGYTESDNLVLRSCLEGPQKANRKTNCCSVEEVSTEDHRATYLGQDRR